MAVVMSVPSYRCEQVGIRPSERAAPSVGSEHHSGPQAGTESW